MSELVPGSEDLGTFHPRTFEEQSVGDNLFLVSGDGVPAGKRVTEAVNVLSFLGQPIAGLVVVARTPAAMPSHTRSRLRLLEGKVPHILRFPYVARFHFVDRENARSIRLPRKARAVLGTLTTLVVPTTHTPPSHPFTESS
ncbi:hypothetical protein [Nocardiopsis sp. MG754419]|uniref:hypothetical protein n=1 Tax=Nocardiopsis sp. MG754419 TaxID=2259865 RepID=UPI001BA99E25|nr:hypothetical protein [Nocardiopsis sp. MG754419]MBR8741037.1 hypothetical protein [Nocardiopsis sp. MG754419]